MVTIKASYDRKKWIKCGTFLTEEKAYLSLAYQKATDEYPFVKVQKS